jgi:fatty acid desaturase
MLVVLWAGRIADALATSAPSLHGETTMTVQALDLGLVVPISVLIAVAALRRDPAGLAAAAAFAVTFVTMSAAIAAMMVSSWIVTGVWALPPILVFSAASLAGLWVAQRMYGSATARGADAEALSRAPVPRVLAG